MKVTVFFIIIIIIIFNLIHSHHNSCKVVTDFFPPQYNLIAGFLYCEDLT